MREQLNQPSQANRPETQSIRNGYAVERADLEPFGSSAGSTRGYLGFTCREKIPAPDGTSRA